MNIQNLNRSLQHSNIYSLSNVEDFKEGTFFALPKLLVDQHFTKVQHEVDSRWDNLTDEISFPKYEPQKSDDAIAKEFARFHQIRLNLHANFQTIPFQARPDFLIAQNIFTNHHFRQPNCISFEHSKADDSYNCSCITNNGRKFFALEGPTDKTVEDFYHLLGNWNVSTLVCLTGEEENGTPKCFPYWTGNTFQRGGEDFFALPLEGQYEIAVKDRDKKKLNYISLPQWQDHSGFKIETLVEEVNKARKKTDSNEIMAIHCSAGVGRTGTFLAIVCLLEEIDKQLACGKSLDDLELSISELFLKLNFSRRQLISREAQYITVYRAVDYYLKQVSNN
ncbi:MAG: hypothetical protein S4CHLAM6_15120 [Chlamydiae bacterium]|nr:hypothetical protein [Chlamydiota bacterium]